MSSDLIGRRRALEERLDRARALELFLKEKTDVLAELTGLSIEEIDFDGSFRASLAAVAGVAARRVRFDIVVSLPGAPFGVRIQNIDQLVSAEVVVQQGGDFEPLMTPLPDAATSEPAYRSGAEPIAPAYAAPLADADPPTDPGGAPQSWPPPPVPAGAWPGQPREAPEADHWSRPAQPAQPTQPSGADGVAADLAALLWQNVDDLPT